MTHVTKKTVFWILAAGGTLALFSLAPYRSSFIEAYFSQGLFSLYRTLWDHTVALSPIPLIYIVIFLSLIYLIEPWISFEKGVRLRTFAHRVIRFLCLAVVIFYWSWGFNYKRASLNERLSLGDDLPTEEWVREEYCQVTDRLVTLRAEIEDFEAPLIYESERQIRDDLEQLFLDISLPRPGRVRARKITPKGSLLHLSTAGVYLPWAGEGHIDRGLHPAVHPYTMMHEMSHGYGWAGEDECNFLALLGTVRSEDVRTVYSGYFGYWRYLRYQLYTIDGGGFDAMYRKGDEQLMKDYDQVLSYSRRYKEVLPALRDLFYDSYLKSHGISSGLINYNQMIQLAYRWENKHGSLLASAIANPEAQ